MLPKIPALTSYRPYEHPPCVHTNSSIFSPILCPCRVSFDIRTLPPSSIPSSQDLLSHCPTSSLAFLSSSSRSLLFFLHIPPIFSSHSLTASTQFPGLFQGFPYLFCHTDSFILNTVKLCDSILKKEHLIEINFILLCNN